MIKVEIPLSQYSDEVIHRNKMYYKYICPLFTDHNTVITYELSFSTEPSELDILNLKNANIPFYKGMVISQITQYDVSDAVNGFSLNGEHCWLDKATRVGLVNSINTEKAAGKETTTLYFNGQPYTLDVDDALDILSQVELYAIDCYRVTEDHKATVSAYIALEDILTFDITSGYPLKLSFTV